MKEIHIRAYCGSNLGDDMFIQHLAKRYPQHKFYLYALSPYDAAFRQIPNICLPSFGNRVLRKLTHTFHLPRMEKFDGEGVPLAVTIGGSILWENADISFGGENVKRYLVGPNCDTGYSPEFYEKLRASLEKVNHCCFRDRYSFSLFQDLPNVSYAPDVLFGWKTSQSPEKGKGIGISLLSPSGRKGLQENQEAYYGGIAQLCDLCQKESIPVRLLGFCKAEGDEKAIQEVLERVADPAYPKVHVYAGDVEAMMDQMNACETILATRFHGMILGWVLGKNVVPVIYSCKQTHVLEDTGFCGAQWRLLNGEHLNGAQLLDAVKSHSGYLDIGKIKADAEKQFAALDAELQ